MKDERRKINLLCISDDCFGVGTWTRLPVMKKGWRTWINASSLDHLGREITVEDNEYYINFKKSAFIEDTELYNIY